MKIFSKQLLGQILISRGYISPENLNYSLSIQLKTGSKLGKILVSEGFINYYILHKVLAEQQGVKFVNLIEMPCDKELLAADKRIEYLSYNAIPWKKFNNYLIIATSDITSEVTEWACQNFSSKLSFVITSPIDIFKTVDSYFQKENVEDAMLRLIRYDAKKSAACIEFHPSKVSAIAVTIISLACFYTNECLLVFTWTTNLFYLITTLFKTLLFAVGLRQRSKIPTNNIPAPQNFPIYSILIPLYKEHKILKKLFASIRAIDYPKTHLDIKLVIESDDDETYQAIKSLACEDMFEVIRVPFSLPRTKGKALNYALNYARGKYVTIYDAEDRPDPQQLKKAVIQFAKLPNNVICLQASLNYYNRQDNLLSRLFSIEYAIWFDFILPGLEKLQIPIPLGGTSNHFVKSKLIEIGAWDAFNVTEDADLGIRIARHNYKSKMLDSVTLEECPVTLKAWIRQRTRWIKGYMQTYIVHMRSPVELYKSVGFKGFLGFQIFIGATCITFISIPYSWLISLIVILIKSSFFDYLAIITKLNLVMAWLVPAFTCAVAVTIKAKAKVNKWKEYRKIITSIFITIIFPFYWLLHPIAGLRALNELFKRPFYWDKTDHGLSRRFKNRNCAK